MNNKKGITLMELLAYLAIVGIVVVLLTSTMNLAIQSYDEVNGQGALNTEANFIMSNLMTKAFAFDPVYAKDCDGNCVDLVVDKKTSIDTKLGIIIEEDLDPDEHAQIRIDDTTRNIYIGDMVLNNSDYAVDNELSDISFDCNGGETVDVCTNFVLNVRLAIYHINDNGDKISDIAIYENRFSI